MGDMAMQKKTPCGKGITGECIYVNYAKGRDSGFDVTALIISYLILWVDPEKSLFPLGLALYIVPCIMNTAKIFASRTGARFMRWANAAVCVIIGIVAFMGAGGSLLCKIENDINYVYTSDSLRSLIRVEYFPTVWILLLALIPVITAIYKYCECKSREA